MDRCYGEEGSEDCAEIYANAFPDDINLLAPTFDQFFGGKMKIEDLKGAVNLLDDPAPFQLVMRAGDCDNPASDCAASVCSALPQVKLCSALKVAER